jgi:hypothetical protein
MPQHTRWVFQHPNESRDLHLVVLNRRSVLPVRSVWSVQLPEVDETRETPIAFLGNETVVGVC